MAFSKILLPAVVSVLAAQVYAQSSCSTSITPTKSIQPSIASGFESRVIATGLTKPRSLEFDSAGHLLVLEQGKGLSQHTLNNGSGTCVGVASSKNVIDDASLNHGLALASNGTTLFVSNSDKVYAFDYDAGAGTVSNNRTIVYNMNGTDHVSRTLLIPTHVDDTLVITRGSLENLDPTAADLSNQVSTVKSFDLSSIPDGGFDYLTTGTLLGWGLRNEVGVAEHPLDGGIWGVENSADNINRSGVDVHATNPAEELNWLGYLNGTKVASQGSNFGYPTCFTVWDPSILPDAGNLTVGNQFALDSNVSCSNYTQPRLAFHPHTAPLDIKFNDSGSTAWISFHGSWNSPDPVGYYVGYVNFENGQPTAPSTSNTSLHVVLANQNNSACPGNCLRPAGLKFDSRGRLFVSSDASGEIYIVERTTADTNSTTNGTTGAGNGGTGTTTSSGAGASATTGAASLLRYDEKALAAGLFGLLVFVVGMI